MPADEKWHDQVTASIGGKENYGKGIYPNPWVEKQAEYLRRWDKTVLIDSIKLKIQMIFEPRFITGLETCELMESLIKMIGAKSILELGMCTGFGTLHFLRAIVGIEGARVTSIDARPAHDREFFAQPDIARHFRFIEGWLPGALEQLMFEQFDFVFVDSDHSVEATVRELTALMPLTHRGSIIALHDCPEWQTPSNHKPPPVRVYLQSLIDRDGAFDGMLLPSPRQLDCEEEWSSDYPIQCSPGLAVLIRK